ncbi:SDR family oxidoreductase [Hymenobacter sp. GOD-10R]|uniref:SDR family oxidoreductase n=1 Tax=Hymenobacter sp. GOD-10R TaxID=3093922 RepID=UPI002D786B2F|nr:SDR family oxidoreductase [Hymenobacter sp. GOD-10R]WRQ28302.1 SDR family oxidoreductase [Hymenobacter sp. GOD-10R]
MQPSLFSSTVLAGQHALVGGSTQGIGRAVAETLAQMGATVTLLARNKERLQQTATELPTPANQAHDYIAADFTDATVVAAQVRDYLAAHPKGFDILINNTGGPAGGPILAATADAFRAAFEQHLVCNQVLAQLIVPSMQARRYGRIINVISTSVKQPLPNLGVSNTIRAAVGNWAKTLANEIAADGITVNNVLPGATVTQRHTSLIEQRAAQTGKSIADIESSLLQLIPTHRFGQSEEIAAAVAFLASPAASYITGINVPVDGGRTGNL